MRLPVLQTVPARSHPRIGSHHRQEGSLLGLGKDPILLTKGVGGLLVVTVPNHLGDGVATLGDQDQPCGPLFRFD